MANFIVLTDLETKTDIYVNRDMIVNFQRFENPSFANESCTLVVTVKKHSIAVIETPAVILQILGENKVANNFRFPEVDDDDI